MALYIIKNRRKQDEKSSVHDARADHGPLSGGLLGKQIEIIAYDNAGKNEEVVNIVNKLCYADKVNVIIGPPPAPTPSLPPPLSTRRRSP